MTTDTAACKSAADRERIGEYVRRALLTMLQRAGGEWPCQVEWYELGLLAHVPRPPRTDFVRQRFWWEPANRASGNRLAREIATVLLSWWRKYQGADETGWRRRQIWQEVHGALLAERGEREGRVVTVHLAPGVRFGTTAGGSLVLL